MTGFTKKSIDKYIRNRMMNWIYDLGRDARVYLIKELELSSEEEATKDDKDKIRAFQQKVRDSIIVTGGCFTSMLQGDLPNDVDIYLRDNETATLIAKFYLAKMMAVGSLDLVNGVSSINVIKSREGISIYIKSQGITGIDINSSDYRYFEAYPEAATDEFFSQYRKNVSKELIESGKGYQVQFMSSNAITLNNGIQIIVRFTGEPAEIHQNFDFIHATNYWTWEEGVVYNEEALAATLEKRLRYFGSKFPVASIFRLKKFIERGWRISAGEMVKIMYDISKLDLDDISVLRDQSMGMDSAYFAQVIKMLHDKHTKNEDIDRTYLFNVINEVFNMHDKQDSFLEGQSESVEIDLEFD